MWNSNIVIHQLAHIVDSKVVRGMKLFEGTYVLREPRDDKLTLQNTKGWERYFIYFIAV